MACADVASDLLPFNPALYDLGRIKGVLEDWLHPPQHPGLKLFPEAPGAQKGFLVITLKPVPELDRYELTTKTETACGRGVRRATGAPWAVTAPTPVISWVSVTRPPWLPSRATRAGATDLLHRPQRTAGRRPSPSGSALVCVGRRDLVSRLKTAFMLLTAERHLSGTAPRFPVSHTSASDVDL